MRSVLVDTEEWHSKRNATCFSIFADTPVFERSTQAEEPSIMEQGWISNGYLTIKAPVSLLLTVQSWWSHVVWMKLFRTIGFFLNEGEAQQPSVPSFLFRTKPQIKLTDWCVPNRQQYGWVLFVSVLISLCLCPRDEGLSLGRASCMPSKCSTTLLFLRQRFLKTLFKNCFLGLKRWLRG